jgi:hypothetical protein
MTLYLEFFLHEMLCPPLPGLENIAKLYSWRLALYNKNDNECTPISRSKILQALDNCQNNYGQLDIFQYIPGNNYN